MKSQFETFTDQKVWRKAALHLSRNDKRMAKLVKKTKYIKRELEDDYYGSIIRSMIFQQISGAAGNSIIKKFKGLYGDRFPSPSEFLKTKEKIVRSAGISPQKYSYIKDLCQRIENGQLELRKFKNMEDEIIIKELDDVKGIGRWTAEMFLMMSLGRTDVLPVDDLGFRNAIKRIYNLKEAPDKNKIKSIATKWHPYSSIGNNCNNISLG
jgi:DNA-3-methyladenine glycosylase II